MSVAHAQCFTDSQPDLRAIGRRGASATHYHRNNRGATRSLDVFDESSYPLTGVKLPEEYTKHDPEHKFIQIY